MHVRWRMSGSFFLMLLITALFPTFMLAAPAKKAAPASSKNCALTVGGESHLDRPNDRNEIKLARNGSAEINAAAEIFANRVRANHGQIRTPEGQSALIEENLLRILEANPLTVLKIEDVYSEFDNAGKAGAVVTGAIQEIYEVLKIQPEVPKPGLIKRALAFAGWEGREQTENHSVATSSDNVKEIGEKMQGHAATARTVQNNSLARISYWIGRVQEAEDSAIDCHNWYEVVKAAKEKFDPKADPAAYLFLEKLAAEVLSAEERMWNYQASLVTIVEKLQLHHQATELALRLYNTVAIPKLFELIASSQSVESLETLETLTDVTSRIKAKSESTALKLAGDLERAIKNQDILTREGMAGSPIMLVTRTIMGRVEKQLDTQLNIEESERLERIFATRKKIRATLEGLNANQQVQAFYPGLLEAGTKSVESGIQRVAPQKPSKTKNISETHD